MEVTRRVTVVYSVVLVDKKEFFFFKIILVLNSLASFTTLNIKTV